MNELNIAIFKALNIEKLNNEIEFLRSEVNGAFDKKIIGNSQKMHEIFGMIEKVAVTNATILITGESGTGKEAIAGAIHSKSNRKDKPYIKVNCGAIPESLIESELFGYEKAAFTGASGRKLGRFDRAQEGTLFLDEIGELNLSMQVKILRVLQEKEFKRVGGTEVLKSDVRIVAATNKNLEKIVEEGQFREDLYYRLKVVPIYIPALRERKEDIPLLSEYFIKKYSEEISKEILHMDSDAMEILMAYDFPGNIRELENLIERLVIHSSNGHISISMLPKELVKGTFSYKKDLFILPEEGINLEELDESLARQALERSKGNQTHAAKLLGISRHSLIYRMEKNKLKENPIP